LRRIDRLKNEWSLIHVEAAGRVVSRGICVPRDETPKVSSINFRMLPKSWVVCELSFAWRREIP
jgi:hypothetical protein